MCCIILQICKCLNEWNSTVLENYNEIRSVQINQYLDFCELFQRKKDSCTQGIIFRFLGNGNVAHLSDYAFHLWALQNYLFHIAFTCSLINLNGVLIYLESILCVCSLVFFSLWTMHSLVPKISLFLLADFGSNYFLVLVQYDRQH